MRTRTQAKGTRQKATARAVAFCLFSYLLVLAAVGCRNCDVVEAELRSREHDLREVHEELCRTQAYNAALQRELRALRLGPAAALPPEVASQTYTLKSLVLGRQTGGYNEDDCPGDEALQVVLEPRDADGHTIKAPGSVAIFVSEITPEGLKKPLCSWQVAAEPLRSCWRSGLWSTGYFLVLPWKSWPTTEKLRVVAQFTLPDGRLFEADRDVTIRRTPQAYRKQTSPEKTDGPELIPSPRKVSPPAPDGAKPPLSQADTPTCAEPAVLWNNPSPGVAARPVQLLRPALGRHQP
jgi:hypothetical protein